MRRGTPAGTLAFPAALFAASLLLVAVAVRAPADERGVRVELELAGVLPMPEGPSGILVLREKGTDTILPLIVPDGRVFDPDGERGGGLLAKAVEALGGEVAEVEIERAQESAAGARVSIAQGPRRLDLHAAPSESIALAVAARAPIVTTRRVLDEAGLTMEDLARAHPRSGTAATRL